MVDVFFEGDRQRVRAVAPGEDIVDDCVDGDQCGVFPFDVFFDEPGETAVGAAVKVVGAQEIVGHTCWWFLPLLDKDKCRVFVKIAGDEPGAGAAVDLHLFLGDVGFCGYSENGCQDEEKGDRENVDVGRAHIAGRIHGG